MLKLREVLPYIAPIFLGGVIYIGASWGREEVVKIRRYKEIISGTAYYFYYEVSFTRKPNFAEATLKRYADIPIEGEEYSKGKFVQIVKDVEYCSKMEIVLRVIGEPKRFHEMFIAPPYIEFKRIEFIPTILGFSLLDSDNFTKVKKVDLEWAAPVFNGLANEISKLFDGTKDVKNVVIKYAKILLEQIGGLEEYIKRFEEQTEPRRRKIERF
jgi:hypothetical protein